MEPIRWAICFCSVFFFFLVTNNLRICWTDLDQIFGLVDQERTSLSADSFCDCLRDVAVATNFGAKFQILPTSPAFATHRNSDFRILDANDPATFGNNLARFRPVKTLECLFRVAIR